LVLISHKSTAFGRSSQPNSVGKVNYRIRMSKKDPKHILWENVSTLMIARYGKENLGRMATDAGLGPATMTRLKQAETSTGIDIVAAIAKVFHLQPWQLLVSDLSVASPPALTSGSDAWPFPSIDRARFEALQDEQRIEIQGVVRRMIADFENASRSVVGTKVLGVKAPPIAGGNVVQQTAKDTERLSRTGRHAPSTTVSKAQAKAGKSGGGSKM